METDFYLLPYYLDNRPTSTIGPSRLFGLKDIHTVGLLNRSMSREVRQACGN